MSGRPVKTQSERGGRARTAPTSTDVARRANVSQATVSYVLNNVTTQRISEKTRASVLSAAEELGYRPNRAAQSLVTGSSRVVLLVVPTVHLGEITLVITNHLTVRAAERGATLSVHFDGPGTRTVIDIVRDLRPRAVFSMFGLDDETAEWLRQSAIPWVSLLSGDGLAQPLNDRSGSLRVGHLVGQGHSVMAYADTAEPGLHAVAQPRSGAATVACRNLGLPDPLYAQLELDGRDAEAVVQRWVDAGVTAVIAYNDEVAIAVLAGIRRAGLRCPQDLAVIGMDEMAINASMEPPLSSVAIDTDRLALLYADSLSTLLDGETAHPQEEVGDTLMRIIERASTLTPRRPMS